MSAFQNCSKFENRTENGKANNPNVLPIIKETLYFVVEIIFLPTKVNGFSSLKSTVYTNQTSVVFYSNKKKSLKIVS